MAAYSSPTGAVVMTVNGTPVRSLAHLVEVLRDLKDEFVTFEFDGRIGRRWCSAAKRCSPPPTRS